MINLQLGYRGRNAGFITPPAVNPCNDNFLMRNCKMITQSELKELLNYDPKIGVFVWKIDFFRAKAGSNAGHRHSTGYVVICIRNKRYKAHRLAWLWVHGFLPKCLDHINHDGYDNRIVNLREVTHLENHKNTKLKKNNTSEFNGVCLARQKKGIKWRAYVNIKGKQINLGFFSDKEKAIDARKAANIKYGFHENHGK